MRVKRHFAIFIIFLLIMGNRCSITVKESQIKSPYQQALESYYTALKNRNNLEALKIALGRVNSILVRYPYDLECRALRANIYLMEVRSKKSQDLDTVNKMIRDLQIISESVSSANSSSDWVQPRAYVTMGDYLLLEGNRVIHEASLKSKDIYIPWEAKAYFEAARDYHAYAHRLADSGNASVALKREAGNALSGYVQAQQGIIVCLDIINPQGDLETVRKTKMKTLKELLAFYEANGFVTPGANVVSFSPSAHNSIREVYKLMADELNQDILKWCKEHKTLSDKPEQDLTDEEKKLIEEAEDLIEKRRLYLEYAATHATVEKTLNPEANAYDIEFQLLKNAYEMDLKSFCKALSSTS